MKNIKCDSPNADMRLCNNCKKNQSLKENDDCKIFYPEYKLSDDSICTGYEHKNQGSLF